MVSKIKPGLRFFCDQLQEVVRKHETMPTTWWCRGVWEDCGLWAYSEQGILQGKDKADALRVPTKWTALGAIGFPAATAHRLVKLGLLERRLARPGSSRMWDYRRVEEPNH